MRRKLQPGNQFSHFYFFVHYDYNLIYNLSFVVRSRNAVCANVGHYYCISLRTVSPTIWVLTEAFCSLKGTAHFVFLNSLWNLPLLRHVCNIIFKVKILHNIDFSIVTMVFVYNTDGFPRSSGWKCWSQQCSTCSLYLPTLTAQLWRLICIASLCFLWCRWWPSWSRIVICLSGYAVVRVWVGIMQDCP